MTNAVGLVVFRVDGQRYALPVRTVERIVAAVEVTPLPGAPDTVLGAIEVAGRIVAVMDLRARFGLPRRGITPADQLLLATTQKRTVALAIDEAEAVVDLPDAAVLTVAGVMSENEPWRGAVRLDDGLVLIHDLERFLSADGTRQLEDALRLAQASDRC